MPSYTTEDGITIVYEGDTKDFDKSVSKIRKEITNLGKDVTAYNQNWKKTGNIDWLSKKLDALKEKHRMLGIEIVSYVKRLEYLNSLDVLDDKQKAELEDLPKRIRQAEGKLADCEVQINRTKEAFEKLNKTSLEILQEELDKTGQKLVDIGDKVTALGQAFRPVSQAAMNFLQEGITKSSEYEVALMNLKRTIDKDSDIYQNFDQLDGAIRNLAMNIPATAEEIANMVQLMAQLGVDDKGSDVMLKFAETMIGLSKTTDLSAESAGENIAKLFNIMNADYDSIENFSSALLTLGVRSAATESDITEMALRIGAAGYRAGMSTTDVLALSTALSSVGLKAQAGGSSISKIISTIDKEIATNGDTVKEWAKVAGMSVKEFKNAWSEDAVNVVSAVIDGLHNMKDEGENLNVIFDDLDIKEIRQIDALGRLAGKEGDLAKYLDIANSSFEENAALVEATGLIYNTFDAQIQLTQNTLDEFKREIGDILVPILKEFNMMLRGVFEWFVALSPKAKKIITVITGITAVISPILIAIGKVITGIGKLHFFGSQLLTQFPALEGAIAGVKGAMSAVVGVVGIVIAAIVVLMATSEKFRTAIVNLCKKVWNKLLKPILETIIELVKFLIDMIKTYVIPAIASLGDALAPLIDALGYIIDYIAPALKFILDLLSKSFQLIAGIVVAVVCSAFELLAKGLEKVFGWVRDLFQKIAETGAWNTLVSMVNWAIDAFKGLIGWVEKAFNWMSNFLGKIGEFFNQTSELNTGLQNVVRYTNSRTPNPRAAIFDSGGFGSYNPNVTINVTNTGNTITEFEVRQWANIINDELGRAI